jgi:SsrA-binding protein
MCAKAAESEGIKIVATNRRATFDYALEERFEAGLVLTGGEIKSVRDGKMDLRDAFVQIRSGEAWLINSYVPIYVLATGFAREAAQEHERRDRKLLLKRKEINELWRGTEQRGYTVIATKTYLKKGRAKIEVALAKGKKQYDKRADIARRDANRDIQRALRDM